MVKPDGAFGVPIPSILSIKTKAWRSKVPMDFSGRKTQSEKKAFNVAFKYG